LDETLTLGYASFMFTEDEARGAWLSSPPLYNRWSFAARLEKMYRHWLETRETADVPSHILDLFRERLNREPVPGRFTDHELRVITSWRFPIYARRPNFDHPSFPDHAERLYDLWLSADSLATERYLKPEVRRIFRIRRMRDALSEKAMHFGFTPEEVETLFNLSVPEGFRESHKAALEGSGRSPAYWVNWMFRTWMEGRGGERDPQIIDIFKARAKRDGFPLP
jgi:hypothetical protein